MTFAGPRLWHSNKLADQLARVLVEHDLIGPRERLQARGEIRSLADDSMLLRLAGSDEVADNDQAGRETDAALQARIRERLERGHGGDEFQPDPHRALGVVLMRLRIAEIDEHAVAHISRHKPGIAADHVGNAFVIHADHIAQILGIEPR